MLSFSNIEFYNTPAGGVMCHEHGKGVKVLEETDRELIQWMNGVLSDLYPNAFTRLSELYSVRERNRIFYEFSMVKRFIRCNFGEFDELHPDIDHSGSFCFEEVRCPLRGECRDEGVICKPEINTKLSNREMEVFRLIAAGMEAPQIAEELFLAITTINRHRENIKAKIGVRSVSQMVAYWNQHNFK